ncbi:ParB/RepB/Spo0J family partition protein [Haloferula sargassicola]|uniref:Nucleoid occlusion protein n=1 Tax=Haloferula sargassicola TaxID=490096 RepID=A0ABP9UX74_9BACT
MSTKTEKVVKLDPKLVHISKLNTRQPKKADVAELMASIRAAGQITPAIVRPHPTKPGHFELAAGARRKVACGALGITLDAIIREIPDEDFEDFILTENLQRENPDPMQEAILIERRVAAGASLPAIVAFYGKDEIWLRRRMKLVSLTPAAREAWRPEGAFEHFTTDMMEFIGTLPADEQDACADDPWGMNDFRTLKDLVDSHRRQARSLEHAEWLDDPCTFVDGCGPGCSTSTAESLFPDEKHPCGACLNAECFRKRQGLFLDSRIAAVIGERPISDFVILSGSHQRQIAYKGEDYTAVPHWQQKDRFRTFKKERKNATPALDLTDPMQPVIRWVLPKEEKAGGGTIPTTGDSTAKKESREDRVTGKRLALMNKSIAEAVKVAPMPATAPILKIVAAFGMSGTRSDPGARTIQATWESLDSTGTVPPLDLWSEEPQTPEEVIWNGVKAVIGVRLQFHRNGDLLDESRRVDMERIANLIGFDYAGRWLDICTKEVPVPKSWGAGFDPLTLEPTTRKAA